MNTQAQLTRREMIRGSVAMAALAFVQYPLSTFGFVDPEEGATLVPFLDVQPAGKMLRWEQLTSWITPNDLVFSVSHHGTPTVDANKWQLDMISRRTSRCIRRCPI